MKGPILHIIDTLGVGGAEKLLVGIINSLDEYEQHLIVLNEPETLLKEIIAECQFSNLKVKSGWRAIWPASRAIKKYILENNIGIVHSHLYISNISARIGTPARVKLFNSIHAISSLGSYKINSLSLVLEKFTYKKRHRIISVSREVHKDFDQYVGIKSPSAVLYNYIEERFFAFRPKENFNTKGLRLIAVGNLRYQKNYPYLIEAFKNLPESVSLDVYGDGNMRTELQSEVHTHQLNIRLCGVRDDLDKVLPLYDLFVMSSFYEGQPLSLLEAMAAGLPAMLSNIPVLQEVAGENAIYFSLQNVEDFRNKIQEILQGKYDLRQLAVASHQRVNSFAHKSQYILNLKKLYEEL